MMKFKLMLDPKDPVREELEKLGIENDDDAEYIISKRGGVRYICASKDGQSFYIPADEIIFIESFGHDVIIHSEDGDYATRERLKQFEAMLSSRDFLRVSKSAIISVPHIRKIEASFFQKFILHMQGGFSVDVTRSYYYIFKERMSI